MNIVMNLKNEIQGSSTDLSIFFKRIKRTLFKKFRAEHYLIKDIKNSNFCSVIAFLSSFIILHDMNKPYTVIQFLDHKLSFLSILSILGFVYFFCNGVIRYLFSRRKITSKYESYKYYKIGEAIEILVTMFFLILLQVVIPIIAFNYASRIFYWF